MKLLNNLLLESKIKIIIYGAITLMVSMIFVLSILSLTVDKNVQKFEANKTLSNDLSNELYNKIQNNPKDTITKQEIQTYFDTFSQTIKSNHQIPNYLTPLIVLFTLLLILFIVISYNFNKTLFQSLEALQLGIENFFVSIFNKEEKINTIDILHRNEIGSIIKHINQNINELKKNVEYERDFNVQLEKDNHVKSQQLDENLHYLQQYKYMIDEVESVIQFDVFGNITEVNQHYCDLSKYTKEELIGQPIANFLNSNEKDQNGFAKEITHVITSGSIYKGINSDVAKDGKVFTTKTVILPMIPKKDEIIEYFYCIRTNITPLIELTNEIIATQKDVIFTLATIGELRSKETGQHVKRVAEYSKLLALKYGLSKDQADLLCYASPMHDIGKVGIPDAILNKPGKLTFDEYETMKTHATLGYEMLKNSNREILSAAAIISHEHHERYDGTGYPNKKSGEAIHIFGRITAIADTFDALGSDRCYKKAWALKDILTLFQNEKGKHFDPNLIDLFIANINEFIEIRDQFQDNLETLQSPN